MTIWATAATPPVPLIPAALSLALLAWLLTLHPTAAGRVYAAYGAVYVSVALVWLQVVDGVPLTLGPCGFGRGLGGDVDLDGWCSAELG